jgi:hypothetical protein
MKKAVLLLVAVAAGSFGALVQTASAEPDSVMCTLEKKGLYHSPLYSACADEPPYGP